MRPTCSWRQPVLTGERHLVKGHRLKILVAEVGDDDIVCENAPEKWPGGDQLRMFFSIHYASSTSFGGIPLAGGGGVLRRVTTCSSSVGQSLCPKSPIFWSPKAKRDSSNV